MKGIILPVIYSYGNKLHLKKEWVSLGENNTLLDDYHIWVNETELNGLRFGGDFVVYKNKDFNMKKSNIIAIMLYEQYEKIFNHLFEKYNKDYWHCIKEIRRQIEEA